MNTESGRIARLLGRVRHAVTNELFALSALGGRTYLASIRGRLWRPIRAWAVQQRSGLIVGAVAMLLVSCAL